MLNKVKLSWCICNIALIVVSSVLIAFSDQALKLSTIDISAVQQMQRDWIKKPFVGISIKP
jgi:hypothetical protein